MTLTVRLFARARDIAGAESVALELPDSATVADLRAALVERYPPMRPLADSLLIAVGTDYAAESKRLAPADQIACFPPVSGG
ncbi:MAG: MoaD/ThiS family protein [Planctomycetaceae bacterium]